MACIFVRLVQNQPRAQPGAHLHVAGDQTLRGGRARQGEIMVSAILGIVGGMALMFGASLYLRELRLLRRPDRRWTGKKH
ncbi:hypothetical protein [Paraburkholderia fungorum]|uniref:Uncharacterized protein n=1 Tax=Paraburkholderia fungorum TaxID=134537 RepID=A0AAP5UVK2_9BURK|nr:hypothetical protein [Paraburkholderia fungorum]MBB4519291.1 hypothetical protein [Paraburkholderia fungorum]MBB6206257.1 hypothetical protein [Paraburkholderia fungorum]MDT8840810.1 hypothetical protein [Paraburkholderia fungorum]PZR50339.1 MAG: hypothetical protein DI523_04445 [Paraburkholderia fungorum]QLD53509.1 hypothetical protein C9419_32700 [Paraburkholderia fungorum]